MTGAHKKHSAEKRTHKTRNDIILAAVLLLVAAASFLWWRMNREQGAFVSVRINGAETAVYSLEEDLETVIYTGEKREYTNVLVIRDGAVTISQANCPDGICVKTRAAANVGDSIVCLPHRLVVEIEAADADAELDLTV